MDANKKHDEIVDYAARIIRHKAKQLIGTAGFTRLDREDLEQEMMLDLLMRLPKFDPNKSTHKTFVARVVERKVSNLIRHRTQEMRDYRRETYSLNEPIDDGDGGTIERSQTIADQHDRRPGRHRRSDQEAVELVLDVQAMLMRLPADLRRLCELLKSGSIADAVREMDIPRTTLNYRVKKLRKLFEKAGLRDYLRDRPSFWACAG